MRYSLLNWVYSAIDDRYECFQVGQYESIEDAQKAINSFYTLKNGDCEFTIYDHKNNSVIVVEGVNKYVF